MPDISEMSESRFLKKEEVGSGKLLTIASCQKENVAKKDEKPEYKYTLNFEEVEKGMVLNRINSELIAQITGERNSDNWAGFKVVLYSDPTIAFGGKLVGGIRVRAPKGQAAQSQPQRQQAHVVNEVESDDIPF